MSLAGISVVAGSGPCGFSGDGGRATGAEISNAIGQFAYDAAGNLYFTDTNNNRVRRIDATTGVIRTVGGNGLSGYAGDGGASTSAAIQAPVGLAVGATGLSYTTGLAANSAYPTGTVIRSFGTVGDLNLGSIVVGSSFAAQTVLVSNVLCC